MNEEQYIVYNDLRLDAIKKFDVTKDYSKVIEAVVTVEEASNIARREGLLALEDAFGCGDSHTVMDDCCFGILMVIDGMEPILVAEALSSDYWSNRYEGNDALKQAILIRGILAIQQGENPRTIEYILMTMLPTCIREECRKAVQDAEEKRNTRNTKQLKEKFSQLKRIEFSKNEELTKNIKLIEESILILDNRDVQRLMRDIETSNLTYCLGVFGDEGKQKLLENMSDRLSVLLIEDLLDYVKYEKTFEREVEKAVENIKRILMRLLASGEIFCLELEEKLFNENY